MVRVFANPGVASVQVGDRGIAKSARASTHFEVDRTEYNFPGPKRREYFTVQVSRGTSAVQVPRDARARTRVRERKRKRERERACTSYPQARTSCW